jgi:calcineurin-like phosphoesterase family protein
MTTWFTSDTHYWHRSIIGYCNRPAIDVEAMNTMLIAKYKEKVKPEDTVYHLGDFAFCNQTRACEILEQLPGKKHWIVGNHDHKLIRQTEKYWTEITPYKLLMEHIKYKDDEGQSQQYHMPIVLFHFPILSWDGMAHGSWHLHGHCHGSLRDNGSLRLDMGVDCWNYSPVSLEEVQNEMALRTVVPVDHHDKRENNPRFKHLLQLKKE